MPRLFVAFTLPAAVREEVARVAQVAALRGVREVPRENLHITVAFLGERPDADAVEDALRRGTSECEPAHVRLGTLGGFPSPRRAQVVWVGISDPSGALAADVRALDGALGAAPFSVARDRPYVPHVTVARARSSAGPVPAVEVAPVPFTIGSVELMESVLRGGRPPKYQVLASLPFSRSAGSS